MMLSLPFDVSMPFSFFFSAFYVELLLVSAILLLILLGAFRGERATQTVYILSLAALAFAFVSCMGQMTDPKIILFSGFLVEDSFSRFAKSLVLLGAFVSLLLSKPFLQSVRIFQFEYPLLILLSTLGMSLLVSAHSLLIVYLGLELMSLSLYALAALHRDDVKATEAGLKYFTLGALASGMLLYGLSLLYGASGTLLFGGLAQAFAQAPLSLGAVFGLAFLLAGLAFKISAAPFHMWTPDVYEGAPTPVTLFFASAPKMAAFTILLRLLFSVFPHQATEWQPIMMFLAFLSMGIGAFAAIGQTNIKRLMAYSSIGHMGFALVGLSATGYQALSSSLLYLLLYLLMTLGTFAALLMMRVNDHYVDSLSDLSGLSQTQPFAAFCLSIMMFSLAGIPPLAGFFAKWYVLLAAVQSHLYPLVLFAIFASAVSCFYYLRIVKIMYFDAPNCEFTAPPFATQAVLTLSALLLFGFFIFPQPFLSLTQVAALSLLP